MGVKHTIMRPMFFNSTIIIDIIIIRRISFTIIIVTASAKFIIIAFEFIVRVILPNYCFPNIPYLLTSSFKEVIIIPT